MNDDELISRRKKQIADRIRAYRKRKKDLGAMPSTSTVQSGEPVSENVRRDSTVLTVAANVKGEIGKRFGVCAAHTPATSPAGAAPAPPLARTPLFAGCLFKTHGNSGFRYNKADYARANSAEGAPPREGCITNTSLTAAIFSSSIDVAVNSNFGPAFNSDYGFDFDYDSGHAIDYSPSYSHSNWNLASENGFLAVWWTNDRLRFQAIKTSIFQPSFMYDRRSTGRRTYCCLMPRELPRRRYNPTDPVVLAPFKGSNSWSFPDSAGDPEEMSVDSPPSSSIVTAGSGSMMKWCGTGDLLLPHARASSRWGYDPDGSSGDGSISGVQIVKFLESAGDPEGGVSGFTVIFLDRHGRLWECLMKLWVAAPSGPRPYRNDCHGSKLVIGPPL
ncbi:hypothetical protein EVAR_75488_1 [Eumeta japonica]|uniref:Uncharacterized protein n=1 Tax=Eumeta variegata TaxID=151549 RepID=A0A4C1TK82_EUMVA|nr:hypothetical protein EVAR_75488_1 [Eumeta japonica]